MKMSDYQIYIFECDYVDFDDNEQHVHALVMAPSMHEAVEAIEKRLPYCTNLFITEYDDMQFVFLNKTLFNRLIDPSDEYGLDFPEEEIEICGQDDDEDIEWTKPRSYNRNPEDAYREDFTRFDSDAEDDEAW